MFARGCSYLFDALMERATEALSSKLVACHCGFGGGIGASEVVVRARLRHAKVGKVPVPGEGDRWETSVQLVAPLHWACAARVQPPKLGA